MHGLTAPSSTDPVLIPDPAGPPAATVDMQAHSPRLLQQHDGQRGSVANDPTRDDPHPRRVPLAAPQVLPIGNASESLAAMEAHLASLSERIVRLGDRSPQFAALSEQSRHASVVLQHKLAVKGPEAEPAKVDKLDALVRTLESQVRLGEAALEVDKGRGFDHRHVVALLTARLLSISPGAPALDDARRRARVVLDSLHALVANPTSTQEQIHKQLDIVDEALAEAEAAARARPAGPDQDAAHCDRLQQDLQRQCERSRTGRLSQRLRGWWAGRAPVTVMSPPKGQAPNPRQRDIARRLAGIDIASAIRGAAAPSTGPLQGGRATVRITQSMAGDKLQLCCVCDVERGAVVAPGPGRGSTSPVEANACLSATMEIDRDGTLKVVATSQVILPRPLTLLI